MFTAKKYIKENPDMITKMANGHTPKLNENFIVFFEENNNKVTRLAQKEDRSPTISERWKSYKNAWKQYQANKSKSHSSSTPIPETKTESTPNIKQKLASFSQASSIKAPVLPEKVQVAIPNTEIKSPVLPTGEQEIPVTLNQLQPSLAVFKAGLDQKGY